MTEPLHDLLGALTGLLVGLTGVGGGAIMTPALISLGIPPLTAIGTDFSCAAITKIAGSSFNSRLHITAIKKCGLHIQGAQLRLIPKRIF